MIDTVVILAGGLATRLRPVTETIPKSMLDVAGKPFIEHQLELLKRNNISEAVICAGFLGEKIKDHIGDGRNFGIDVKYSFDGDKLLGTGGAIKKAFDLLSETFFVMYGDSYLNTDFQSINEYFFSQKGSALMTVFKNNGKWDKSNIDFRNGKILNYDKKAADNKFKFIDYGLGILGKKAFVDFEDSEVIDLEAIYQNLIKKNELLGYEVKERFYEIGSFKGLEETSEYLDSMHQ